MKTIAHIHTDFPQKFGIPRQSGLVESLQGRIVFEPGYRNPEALRGLEDFSHIWLIWEFSQSIRDTWSPTVRPPRLGGNVRMGVFATRSPFRPNPIGLSCVRLEKIEYTSHLGPVLHVLGVDMADGTPLYDLKPYLPFTDSRPAATSGFAGERAAYALEVCFPQELFAKVPLRYQNALLELLAQDPRPSYQQDHTRIYGLSFAGMEVRFTVRAQTLTVCDVSFSSPEQK